MSKRKLCDVTLNEAIEIIKAGYPTFFLTNLEKWELSDRSDDISEPCKKLWNKNKKWCFWFFESNIDINNDEPTNIDFEEELVFDVKLDCYVKAAEMNFETRFDSLYSFAKNKGFIQGYSCCVANLIKDHKENTIAENLLEANFFSSLEMIEAGVEKTDVLILNPIINEIQAKLSHYSTQKM